MATKKDLVKTIIDKLEFLSRPDAVIAIDSIFEYMSQELAKGQRIEIRGFGSFSIRKKKFAGQDRSYNILYFRPSMHVDDSLNLSTK